jgi:hypothetical protein
MVKPREVLSSCALRSKTRPETRPYQSLTIAPGLIVSKKFDVEQLHFAYIHLNDFPE